MCRQHLHLRSSDMQHSDSIRKLAMHVLEKAKEVKASSIHLEM